MGPSGGLRRDLPQHHECEGVALAPRASSAGELPEIGQARSKHPKEVAARPELWKLG
jgi:hypothetical protein